jgi:hypothetical protein
MLRRDVAEAWRCHGSKTVGLHKKDFLNRSILLRAFPSEPAKPDFGRLAGAFVLFALLVNFGLFLFQAWISLGYPYSINSTEGSNWAATFLADKIGLYANAMQWPYIPTSYAPLYYLIAWPLHHFLGLGIAAGRLISLFSTLGIGAVLYKSAAERTGNTLLALMLPLFFFVSPDIFYWGLLYRVDMLMLFFLSVAVYFGMIQNRSPRDRFISIGFLYLAFFTKSNCAGSALVLFAYWLAEDFKSRPIQGLRSFFHLRYLVLFSLLVLITFGVLELVTRGQFIRSVFGLMVGTTFWKPGRGMVFLCYFFDYASPAILLAILGAALKIIRKERLERKFLFSFLGLMIGILHLYVLGNRAGADTNYALEAFLWLFFILVQIFPRSGGGGLEILSFQWTVVISLFLFTCAGSQLHDSLRIADSAVYARARENRDVLTKYISRLPGKVLVEDLAIAIRAGKEPVFESYVLGTLADCGHWDPRNFIQDLQSGRYKYIVAVDGFFTDSKFMPPILRFYYRPVREFYLPLRRLWNDVWTVYEYRGYKKEGWVQPGGCRFFVCKLS